MQDVIGQSPQRGRWVAVPMLDVVDGMSCLAVRQVLEVKAGQLVLKPAAVVAEEPISWRGDYILLDRSYRGPAV